MTLLVGGGMCGTERRLTMGSRGTGERGVAPAPTPWTPSM